MQSSYVTTHISTIFPLVATRPANFKGRTHKVENREIERVAAIAVVEEPVYATEAAVTSAIASGTFKGFANEAYAAAKRYQAYLKQIAKPRFFRRAKGSDATVGLNFRPGYATV